MDTTVQASPRGSASTLEETAALDGLIDILLSAKDNTELGKAVADNLLAFDQKFWIRLATRNDTASSQEQKDRIGDLAGQVMRMVEALVKQSDHQITDSASVLKKILAAAADERGEWQVPLSDASLEAMRKEMEANASLLDESLLATTTAWMRKADKDKLDGMVALLQQVLQLYAARALVANNGGPQQEADDQVLDTVLSARETTWLHHLKAAADSGTVSGNSFLTAVRRRMESIVLALPSGSNAQRIQAEYLKEVEGRAETLFKELNC